MSHWGKASRRQTYALGTTARQLLAVRSIEFISGELQNATGIACGEHSFGNVPRDDAAGSDYGS